jgi:hypothetical protein
MRSNRSSIKTVRQGSTIRAADIYRFVRQTKSIILKTKTVQLETFTKPKKLVENQTD